MSQWRPLAFCGARRTIPQLPCMQSAGKSNSSGLVMARRQGKEKRYPVRDASDLQRPHREARSSVGCETIRAIVAGGAGSNIVGRTTSCRERIKGLVKTMWNFVFI